MTATQHTGSVSFGFDADGYTALDLFVERVDGQGAPTLRLTDSRGGVQERVMDADLFRQRITFDIAPAKRYTLEGSAAMLPYVYLMGGDDILDRGIRVLDGETGAVTAGDGADATPAPCRAAVHYEPPEHWMNDPNGLCRFQGRYHMYYQFNPYGWGWDNMHWGHAVSRDLVHWTHLPVFLEPQRELHADRNTAGGAFSGSAVTVDAEGRPCPGDDAAAIRFYLTRHSARRDNEVALEYQSTLTSADGLVPGPETRIVDRPDEHVGFDFRDPKVETGFDGGAVMAVATFLESSAVPEAPAPGVSADHEGGWFTTRADGAAGEERADMAHIPAVVVYRNATPELRDDAWEYAGPLLVERGYQIGRTFECPDAFPLDGADVVVGAIMHVRTEGGAFQPIRWYVGAVDGDRMTVARSGWVDFGDCFYAVQSFRDDDGRRICIGWLADWCGVRREAKGRANGAMSLPRELHVRDGRLVARPVAEVYDRLVGERIEAGDGGIWRVPGNAYYADIRPDGDFEATLCDTGEASWRMTCRNGIVRCVSRGASSDGVVCEARVDRVERVEVFYDRGVIEVFVNDGEQAGAMLAYDPRDHGVFELDGEAACEVRALRR